MITRKQRTLQARMQRAVRQAEADAHAANLRKLQCQEISGPVQDSGTGQTVLKMQRHQAPLQTLVEAGRIGGSELQAADQIALAVAAVAGNGILHAAHLERIAHGRQSDSPWPMHLAMTVHKYQLWQAYWSAEYKRSRNPMLGVMWSAVIDERPISVIAQDIGCGPIRTKRAIISGLRHYAAFAGLVTGAQATAWLEAARHVFSRRLPMATH